MDDRVTFELLQAARAYRLRSAKLLSRVGLYPGQDALLMLLGERGKLTMGEAANALSIQPPTVTKMVNRLSAAQLVKTEVMDGDRRKISVSLTDAARGKIDEIDAIWRELEEEALDAMNPQPLKSQLSAMARNLRKRERRTRSGAPPIWMSGQSLHSQPERTAAEASTSVRAAAAPLALGHVRDSTHVLLARSVAFTISFHIVFPALSIGLGSYLAVLEGLWVITGQDHYIRLFRVWVKAFALSFGMGVVSGIVLSYQFGTNWSVFSDKTGPVLGPLMGYEVMTAFFLEAGFLGIMLFGVKRVPKAMHFAADDHRARSARAAPPLDPAATAGCQTPAGYAVNGRGPVRFPSTGSRHFNPSFPLSRSPHGSRRYLATRFRGGAAGATICSRTSGTDGPTLVSMAIWMAAWSRRCSSWSATSKAKHAQAPAGKVAAMEGFRAEQKGQRAHPLRPSR